MYIHDQRKPLTCLFSQLNQGDLFAYEDGDDLFYLMVIDDGNVAKDRGKAVVLGTRDCDTHLTGIVWTFEIEDEVQPLNGELKVWAS
jgi:hypothetical protein